LLKTLRKGKTSKTSEGRGENSVNNPAFIYYGVNDPNGPEKRNKSENGEIKLRENRKTGVLKKMDAVSLKPPRSAP